MLGDVCLCFVEKGIVESIIGAVLYSEGGDC